MKLTRPRLTLLLLLLLVLLAGCRTYASGPDERPAPGPDVPDTAYYDVAGDVPAARSDEVIFRGVGHDVLRILLPPRVPEALRHLSHIEDDIEIFFFRPHHLGTEKRPLVLMSPILANSLTLMNEFATGFTRQGFVAAVVMRKEFDFEPRTALDQAEGEFRAYVMQSRQATDYLAIRPEVDEARMATFGVSAGATTSVCLAAVDPRFKAHVLVLAGGPLADVLGDTVEDRFVEYRVALQAATGLDDRALRDTLRTRLVTDPVNLAARVDPDTVLLFLAKRDRSIPVEYGYTLWRAMGRPRLVLLPFGHYTSFLLLPFISGQASRFLAGKLGR